ncbi:Bax inhibitor-1/YccA family membrane protein [Tepidibacter hydrothermalis]|uniref:Bax inhibitor-1/YccA family protein n=1 Tax=Tepidibacter hydrothermalis TaxID=3036126 RepID=A0ABY8EBC0_9FIRM|nr:Bax inhibitor-1/YccA family protein [Tepidibacter hydrothermalis]WFD10218.1 Bax inhibitor-1/YccA family protein [Tepidibacter hydrothermalis]
MESSFSNPYIQRVAGESNEYVGDTCTYGGIIEKAMYFFLVTFIGIGAFLFMQMHQPYVTYILIGAGVVGIIAPLLSYLVPKAIPILGTFFGFAQGYIIGYSCVEFSKGYSGVVPLAIIITFSAVIIMGVLYGSGIVKVDQKFKAIISALFLTSFVFGGVVFISSFFTSQLTSMFNKNGIVAIVASVLTLIVSVLNLAVDFDNITIGVDSGFSKNHEWTLAFGIITSIILIFLKVLKLVYQLVGDDDE